MSLIFAILKASLTPDYSVSYFVFWLLLIASVCLYCGSRPHGLPPGPVGLPILGYLPFLGYQAHVKLRKLGEKYGNVFSFYLGSQLTVVLNDYDAIQEALGKNRELFTGRPPLSALDFTKHPRINLFTADGEHWKEHRRFALSSFRDMGMGKTRHEQILLDEIYEWLNAVRRSDVHEPVDIATPLGRSWANNMFMFMFGRRYDYEDPFLTYFKWKSDLAARRNDMLSITTYFPWIMNIPYVSYLLDRRSMLKPIFVKTELENLELVEDFKKTADEPLHRDNYVHLSLAEEQRRKSKNPVDSMFNDVTLAQNFGALFVAGTETPNFTLQWGIVYLLNYPNVQLKLQQEIDAKVGADRAPSFANRLQTPYVEATVLEILRMSVVLPLNLIHRSTANVKIGGFFIPNGSLIISNLWNAHFDPKLWKHPEKFEPERFLSESGELLKSPDYLMPFSKGKHQCTGESLARMGLYLYLATLMQQFTLEPPPGCDPPSMEPYDGPNLIMRPKYFKVCCIPRENYHHFGTKSVPVSESEGTKIRSF